MRFARNTAIEAFNTEDTRLTNKRRQADQDAITARRAQREDETYQRQQGVDAAIRNVFATPETATPPQPAQAPAPAQPKMPAAPIPGGFNPHGSDYDMASATAAGLQPDDTGHWPSRVPDSGLLLKGKGHPTWALTEKGEKDAGMEIFQGSDGRYYSQPAATQQPAIAQFSADAPAPAPAPAPARSTSARLRESLARTPGGGQQLMQMQQREDQAKTAADRLYAQQFFQAIEKGSVQTARMLNQRYGLGFPEEAFSNRNLLTQVGVGTSLSKQFMGKVDPDFIQAYSEGVMRGMPAEQAAMEAVKAARAKADGKVVKWVTGTDGRVTGLTATGQSVKTDARAHVPGTGAGGRPGSAGRLSVYEQKRQAWLNAHPGDETGALAYAQGTRQTTQAERIRLARGLFSDDQRNLPSQRIYKTVDDAFRDVARLEGAAQAPQATSGGQPAPARDNDPLGIRTR